MPSHETGRREAALCAVLDAVVAGDLEQWSVSAVRSDAAYDDGLRLLVSALSLRWAAGRELVASLPPAEAADPDAWWLRRGAALWLAAGDPGPGSDRGLAGLADGPLPDPASVLGRFAAYTLVEAVLAHGRLDLAAALIDRLGPTLWTPLGLDGREHAFRAVVEVARVRALTFRGDIAGADVVLRAIPAPAGGRLRAFLAATSALVRGNGADDREVLRLVAEVDRNATGPHDLLGAGTQMLAAFGQVALGDVVPAARRVLVAGGDADLARLTVIDRALALEMLVALAVADDDLDAAEAWADHLVPLLASPSADSTVMRALSRVALLAGRPAEAVTWAGRAVARATEVGRLVEAAEGEIVLNRARIAHPGSSGADAARALLEMVGRAERTGHRMARRAAARELRLAGLRLPPMAGSGWAGLSAREAEVARLVSGGASNLEVAEALHVSLHTVRAHVSRVLAAFGVPTRSALPVAIGAAAAPVAGAERLTPRQREVAALVAGGHGNAAIAARLGVSPRTVERHVSDVLERWGLPNRTALAHAWTGR